MQSRCLDEGKEKSYALVFTTGEEASRGILDFARSQGLAGSRFSAIGAFSRATIAYFDWHSKRYQAIPVGEQCEVLSLLGDIALKDGEPQVHAHVVLGLRDGTTRGGHLLEAVVRPTLEVMLTESPRHLRRSMDPTSGLPLITL